MKPAFKCSLYTVTSNSHVCISAALLRKNRKAIAATRILVSNENTENCLNPSTIVILAIVLWLGVRSKVTRSRVVRLSIIAPIVTQKPALLSSSDPFSQPPLPPPTLPAACACVRLRLCLRSLFSGFCSSYRFTRSAPFSPRTHTTTYETSCSSNAALTQNSHLPVSPRRRGGQRSTGGRIGRKNRQTSKVGRERHACLSLSLLVSFSSSFFAFVHLSHCAFALIGPHAVSDLGQCTVYLDYRNARQALCERRST